MACPMLTRFLRNEDQPRTHLAASELSEVALHRVDVMADENTAVCRGLCQSNGIGHAFERDRFSAAKVHARLTAERPGYDRMV